MGDEVPLSRRHNLITIRLSMSSTWELLYWVRDIGKDRASRQKMIMVKGRVVLGIDTRYIRQKGRSIPVLPSQ